ncbi:tape measure protein [Neorhizobium sp. NCHU2750]|uniref:tape measure protein n=1 Tax=Neorhizobium sp. NCHU2750 TaxID=1825976 RepID=UPI000E76B0A8|nr:hypothetical protein NCHU2750_06320 [Neorhizobium sp. NCHU2750]
MAATDLERLVVQLSADITKFDRALSRAQGISNQRARQIETRFSRMSKAINSGISSAAVGLGKGFALIGGAQGLKTLTDSATRIDNALKVAGLSGEDLEKVYQKLFADATKNAAPIETLVGLYGRLSLVQGELGISSDQIVGFTNNIALALRVGGSSAEEASGALLQLSQALGSGTVHAEEFNSIVEGAPTILQAAAAGIKQAEGSVAKLRQIMLAGKLSSKALFDGFQAGAPILEQKVAGAVLTIDQRLTNLQTSLINAAREFNNSSGAANTFGSAIDNMATFINSVDMDGLAQEIGSIINALNQGSAAAQNLANWIGKLSGLQNVGQSVINAFDTDGDGKISAFGGALTIESTVSASEKLASISQKRLDLEKEITDLQSQPERRARANGSLLDSKKAQLAALQSQADKVAGNAIQDTLNNTKIEYPTAAPNLGVSPSATAAKPGTSAKFTPIDISDPKYKPVSTGSGGGGRKGRGGKSDDLQREVAQIKERTDALNAETDAQSKINPLLNDYGYAAEYARTRQELLTAAQKAGTTITPELQAKIDQLAASYANASAKSEMLADKNEQLKQTKDDVKSFLGEIRQGLTNGEDFWKSFGDAGLSVLDKIISKIEDQLASAIVGAFSGGGGGSKGGLFGGLLSIFGLKDGGVVKAATGGKVSGPGTGRSDSIPAMLSDGEYVVNAAATKKHAALLQAINSGKAIKLANGGAANGLSLPNIKRASGGSSSPSPMDVRVTVEDDKFQAYVTKRSNEAVSSASPGIVSKSVSYANTTAPSAVSQAQDKQVRNWRQK